MQQEEILVIKEHALNLSVLEQIKQAPLVEPVEIVLLDFTVTLQILKHV